MPDTSAKSRILIVEDSPSDLDLILEAISDLGEQEQLETLSVTTLGEGFRVLSENSVDLVLLDLGLPDSQGLDTLRRMRSRLSSAPIIVFTSIYSMDVGLEAVRIGAQDFLVKGDASGEALAHAVHCAIVRHQSAEHQGEANVERELDALERVRTLLAPSDGKS